MKFSIPFLMVLSVVYINTYASQGPAKTVQRQPTYLDILPPEVRGIIEQTVAINKRADDRIQNIVANASSLPAVKAMLATLEKEDKNTYGLVSSNSAYLISQLAKKFNRSTINIAAQIDTPAAWQWLKENLLASKELRKKAVAELKSMHPIADYYAIRTLGRALSADYPRVLELVSVAEKNDIEKVKQLVKSGVDVNDTIVEYSSHITALDAVNRKNLPEMKAYLLGIGAKTAKELGYPPVGPKK